jgi:hypothetical protein
VLNFLVIALATYRLSVMLVEEDGPGLLFHKLRKATGVYYDEHSEQTADNVVGQIFSCVWCMSVWVAGVITLLHLYGPDAFEVAHLMLAASGLTVFLHGVAHGRV